MDIPVRKGIDDGANASSSTIDKLKRVPLCHTRSEATKSNGSQIRWMIAIYPLAVEGNSNLK